VAAEGTSFAGKEENGGLRSYGSMTYAGFKSMIYAGLTKDDPRVKTALEWIKKNYSVEKNPGEGDAGLYYYYDTFAAALAASGLEEVTDAAGKTHDWKKELIAELAKRQQPDGSWVNTNRQWFENDPNLATAFALKALSYCKPTTK
jgi:squalene-hopene/tetraprenyl-beta-curcumene cyclase